MYGGCHAERGGVLTSHSISVFPFAHLRVHLAIPHIDR